MPSCSELISGVNWPNPAHKPIRGDGDRWALEAVLEDADRARAQPFVDLGDRVAGPLDPCGTARRLMALHAVTMLGNHDHAVLKGDSSPSAAFAREQLDGVRLDWLVGLPSAAQFESPPSDSNRKPLHYK
jgi:hypothetical protein